MRLGHVFTPVLSHIPTIAYHIYEVFTKTCPICPLSKKTNLSFSLSSSYATQLFDLIPVELWGSYFHKTGQDCRFFLTIVDDHSRAVWTLLLPPKQHVPRQIIYNLSLMTKIIFILLLKPFEVIMVLSF